MHLTHRQLQAFLLVARTRNFSRAAEQLHIAQSGLSTMVRELEEQVGFRLFNRTTRQVVLTELGERFLPVVQRNVSEMEAITAELSQTAAVARQTLTVAAPPLTSAYLLPGVVAQFRKSHPHVQLRVVDTDLASVSTLIREGAIDIGLGMFVKAAPCVERIPLFEFTLAFVQAGKTFRWTDQPIRWADLDASNLIALPADNPLQQCIDGHLEKAGRLRPPAFSVNFIETQLGLAAAGCGAAIVPTTAYVNCIHRKLSMQPIVQPRVDLKFYEVRDRSRQLPSCVDEFTQLLKQHFARGLKGAGIAAV